MIYETDEDRKIEAAGIRRLADFVGLQIMWLAKLCKSDALLFSGDRARRIVEFKRRKCLVREHPDIIIDVEKVESGLELAHWFRCAFTFAVQWDDVYRAIRISEEMTQEFQRDKFTATGRGERHVFRIPIDHEGWKVIP